ncbi:MAG: FG-GAP repeat protein [Candidatus Margulisbacteria bacterium]|nr:FG-GAP repeat protein [Candidatus Margulisiibacteriota bacterium]MBU1021457.1 FG-GAP repeat protein [Candidatus Margulisiibacteriota bacterium]MBU1728378.1 FG-GAP repeat protein [Candidatus Margulisiibacteriota bacterium]MBU1955879.1 FG-GAP repeat protein [Candidatus Margulisiibacteriota bacterium]
MSVIDKVKLMINNTVSKAENIGTRAKYVIRESAKPAGEPIVFNGFNSFIFACTEYKLSSLATPDVTVRPEDENDVVADSIQSCDPDDDSDVSGYKVREESVTRFLGEVSWGGKVIDGTWQVHDQAGSMQDEAVADFEELNPDEDNMTRNSESIYTYHAGIPGQSERVSLSVTVEGRGEKGATGTEQGEGFACVYIDRKPEIIDFYSPEEGEVFYSDQDVDFIAAVDDLEDYLPTLAITWTLDGEVVNDEAPDLNGNTAFQLTDLATGEHTVSLCVTDSMDQEVCETRTFEFVIVEECNGLDDDGDGIIPQNENDNDGDGWMLCEGDCDDNNEITFPGAPEICDGEDNDCDGIIPEDEFDNDGDGYLACNDCNDADPDIYPGAPELCDGIDNDCDGIIPADEFDNDGDGYLACNECDDGDYFINPGMPEDWCNGIDDNCDGIYETDADGDGYYAECDDCDDANDTIYPGAPEIECDGIDQDCDGMDLTNFLSGVYSLGMADASFIGESGGDVAGHSVSSAGDVNGDLFDDLLIGARGNDDGGTSAGKTYLIHGPVYGSMNLNAANASFIGENTGDLSGYSVSNAGDVNADGYGDLLIGAPYNSDGGYWSGKAYLVNGPASGNMDLSAADAMFIKENDYGWAGWSVSNAGDVNADGYDDILIGAPYDDEGGWGAGKAFLFYGPVSGVNYLSTADAILIGENGCENAGMSVSNAEDVNGDGFDDILIGAYKNNDAAVDAGKAYLIFGPIYGAINLSSANAAFIGENYEDYAGYSVSKAGDVNGDGCLDILVGAFANDDGGIDAGKTYLANGPFSGNTALNNASAAFIGEFADDYAGWAVSGAGDVNGDGFDDILVGAQQNDNGGTDSGTAYLIYGSIAGSMNLNSSDVLFIGEYGDDRAGISVSNAGDVDADGYDDILVGAYYNDDGGTSAGKAYLIYGRGCQ